MLFSRYAKLSSVASGSSADYYASVDSGHAPLTSLEVNVTCFGPGLIQAGYWDGTTFSPVQTEAVSDSLYPATLTCEFSGYTNDGSQQVALRVTNLDTVTRDFYLDMTGAEA